MGKFTLFVLFVVAFARQTLALNATWRVLAKEFSAITIGIAFQDDKIGWTSHTDGSSAIQVVKTEDGGQSWKNVKNNTGLHLMMMGIAANKHGELPITNVATTGLGASEYSLDGDNFKTSVLLQLISQDIDYSPVGLTGQMTIAGKNGPCISKTGGAFYECKKIPLKYKGTGRYVSAPSKDVIFMTAGQWPNSNPPSESTDLFHVTRNLRVNLKTYAVEPLGQYGSLLDDNTTYTAELWKSTDGGQNWTNIISDEGNFYFNDIDCFDENHCVAVGEGFDKDGSKSPGARVYVTSDGTNFELVHTESTTGSESLMAAAMLSETEIWVGGTTKTGALLAPTLALHSTDGGKTWSNEYNNVVGNMITAFDFVSSSHGFATTVNALQVSSLLEYTTAAPGPSPSPTPSSGPHYEDPNAGPCRSDEVPIQIQGVSGSICTPQCDDSGKCPTDVPTGVTATPVCALKSSAGQQFCCLECTPAQNDACGENASCKSIQGQGICTYDS